MERRLILAVVLTLGVIFLTNVLFPPAPPPSEELPETFVADSALESPDLDPTTLGTPGQPDSAAAILRGEGQPGAVADVAPTPDAQAAPTARAQAARSTCPKVSIPVSIFSGVT